MPSIKSSIGESNFNASPGKKWSVPDLDNQPLQKPVVFKDPAEVATLRRQVQERAQEAEVRATQNAQQRIDILTGIGRKTIDVPIEDSANGTVIFTLRTLKLFEKKQNAIIMEDAKKITLSDGSVSFTHSGSFDIKRESISNSLYLIDGVSVDIVLGTSNCSYAEQKAAKDWLIENMDDDVIDYLFNKYGELIKSSHIKQPSTPDEVSEVVDSIHKSGETT